MVATKNRWALREPFTIMTSIRSCNSIESALLCIINVYSGPSNEGTLSFLVIKDFLEGNLSIVDKTVSEVPLLFTHTY